MHLVLFFTKGVSLHSWDAAGLFSREVRFYQKLVEYGIDVTFITYGNKFDLTYADRIPGIHICCNRWGLAQEQYDKLIPWLHCFRLLKADFVKSNQMNGADTALHTACRFRKPMIARCGYMWSKNVFIEKGNDTQFCQKVLEIEEEVFSKSDYIIVTTGEMETSVVERFPFKFNHISVVPNYVDTDTFRPCCNDTEVKKNRLCFVGRLAPEKNIGALLQAISELDVELDIIGDGPLRDSLEKQAVGMNGVRFCGRVPNNQLPSYFHRSTAFVFPSLYEGHPKSPIEAMACGLPVIATDVSGVREVIRHGETGWLCNTDSEALRNAISTVLADTALQKRLGIAGREYAVKNFSLERIVQRELQLYRDIIEGKQNAQ